MQMALNLLGEWSTDHGASFHVNNAKTVLFVIGGEQPADELLLPQSGMPVRIQFATDPKRWLGWMWDHTGGASVTMHASIGTARRAFAPLCGLVTSNALPLPLAVPIIASIAEGRLAQGRWLYVVAEEAETALNALQATWARALLGADFWRGATISRWEVGYVITGMGHAVLDMARRRARLWLLPDSDFYKGAFLRAMSADAPTWSRLSQTILQTWGVPEFYESKDWGYRRYVRIAHNIILQKCADAATPARMAHQLPIQHSLLEQEPSTVLRAALRTPLGWETLCGLRARARLRARISVLRHRNGRKNRAAEQKCILCQGFTKRAFAHALIKCPSLAACRDQLPPDLQHDGGQEGSYLCKLFTLAPASPGFEQAVKLFKTIDDAERVFWRGRR